MTREEADTLLHLLGGNKPAALAILTPSERAEFFLVVEAGAKRMGFKPGVLEREREAWYELMCRREETS